MLDPALEQARIRFADAGVRVGSKVRLTHERGEFEGVVAYLGGWITVESDTQPDFKKPITDVRSIEVIE